MPTSDFIHTPNSVSLKPAAGHESMLTGESLPVVKQAGDRVIGGTINKTGAFRYHATTLGSESVLASIVRLMRDAHGSRAPIQKLADVYCSWDPGNKHLMCSVAGCVLRLLAFSNHCQPSAK
jgi:cation transport ATPase